MDERYIATVDMGTSKLALTVAKIAGEGIEVLYYSEKPSDGVRYSRIFNPIRAAGPLKSAVEEAERELSIKINQVVIGLPRWGVRQETSSALLNRDGSSCITQDEIDSIKNIALDSYPLDDESKEEIYGAAAQSFSTEDMINCTEEDVVGQPSSSLEGNFKVFVGAKKAMTNIDIMLNHANLAPARKYFLPSATANAVLTREEKENGVALLEMGAGVTSVTIFQGNILRYYYAIPFGGKSITTDIKMECGFTERLAENIKLAYGACMPEHLQSLSEKILQINDTEDGTDQQLPVKYLSEIITARMKEITDAILFKIQESGYSDRLRNGVVLTGGGANLTNCASFIKEMSGYNVRIGYPRMKRFSASGCPGIGETGAVASLGMLLLAKDDLYVNCTSEVPREEEKQDENPVQEVEQELGSVGGTTGAKPVPEASDEETDNTADSVLDPDAWEVHKPARPPKPRKPHKESKLFKWTKKVSESFSERVGSIYDSME